MENFNKEIMRVLGKIDFPKPCSRQFLSIMGVLVGHEHLAKYQEMIDNPEKQLEMLNAHESNKEKKHFMVLCHILIKDYIKKMQEGCHYCGPNNEKPQKDVLLEDYFEQIRIASEYRPGIAGFKKEKFPEIQKLENSIIRRIFPRNMEGDPKTDTELTSGNYRQLLSVWLLYPNLIFYPEEISKVIDLCKTGKIKI